MLTALAILAALYLVGGAVITYLWLGWAVRGIVAGLGDAAMVALGLKIYPATGRAVWRKGRSAP